MAVGALIFTAEIVAEMVFMYRSLQENAWGMAGLNQYGCDFPTNSWVHGYGFGLETEEGNEEAVESEISPMNQEIVALGEDYINAQGLAKSAAIGTAVMVIFFLFVAKLKKSRRDDE